MGHTKEAHSLPFGHDAKAAEDIDGLVVSYPVQKFTYSLSTRSHQLLEDHLKSLRTANSEEDAEDEQAWDNWLVESDSDSSDSSDWINVESDGSNNLDISDSDNEMADGDPGFARSGQHEHSLARVSLLATTKVRNAPVPQKLGLTSLLDTYAGRFCFNKRPQNQGCHRGCREDEWTCHQTEARDFGSEQKVRRYG